MPANLPAEAKHKWYEASQARKPEEKIEKLREFLSLVPKLVITHFPTHPKFHNPPNPTFPSNQNHM